MAYLNLNINILFFMKKVKKKDKDFKQKKIITNKNFFFVCKILEIS